MSVTIQMQHALWALKHCDIHHVVAVYVCIRLLDKTVYVTRMRGFDNLEINISVTTF